MCGRFFVAEDAWEKAAEAFPALKNRLEDFRTGDITPGMAALALAGNGTGPEALPLLWGFPGFGKGRSLIINARTETAREKPAFADAFRQCRCVFPAGGFYEWTREDRQKVTFRNPDGPVLYLAGLYRPFGEENRFVILTRPADEVMLPVHDRMPLILGEKDVEPWIFDRHRAENLLESEQPRFFPEKQPYEQLSLFDAAP